jgi:Rieske 2Fe-2S family protein
MIETALAADPGAAVFRTPGHSLPGPLYAGEEAYQTDLEAVFGRSWLFVATEPEIAEPGDYVTVEVGRRSIILVRDDDMAVRAFYNVCRHRGSRLLDACSGSVGNIVCPYHQWTYDTEGRLLHAESSGPDLDRGALSLRKVHVRSVAGLIFICLADEAPADFDDYAATVSPYIAPHRLAEAKVATQIDIIEDGNWKLVMENNRECTHCGGHPELIKSLFPVYGYRPEDISPRLRPAFARYTDAHREFTATCDEIGLLWKANEQLETRLTGFRIEREPLDMAGESFTADGRRACRRLLSDEFSTARLGRLSMHVQPNAWFHAMADHAITFSVLPIAPDKSLLRTTWLVHKDAVEGRDYDVDALTLVWRQTNDQDRTFVARAHRGVSDPAYVPGPYLAPEYQVDAFCTWYVDRLAEYHSAAQTREQA